MLAVNLEIFRNLTGKLPGRRKDEMSHTSTKCPTGILRDVVEQWQGKGSRLTCAGLSAGEQVRVAVSNRFNVYGYGGTLC